MAKQQMGSVMDKEYIWINSKWFAIVQLESGQRIRIRLRGKDARQVVIGDKISFVKRPWLWKLPVGKLQIIENAEW